MRINITVYMYKANKHSEIVEINIIYFLVIDPMLLSQIGGELLLSKLNSPVHQVKYLPGMYNEISPGAMLVVDGRLADQLRDAMIRAVQQGSFKRIGVLVLLDKRTLVSKEQLEEVNICLRTMWASTSVIIKPWTDRIYVDRTENGFVPTSTIPGSLMS